MAEINIAQWRNALETLKTRAEQKALEEQAQKDFGCSHAEAEAAIARLSGFLECDEASTAAELLKVHGTDNIPLFKVDRMNTEYIFNGELGLARRNVSGEGLQTIDARECILISRSPKEVNSRERILDNVNAVYDLIVNGVQKIVDETLEKK